MVEQRQRGLSDAEPALPRSQSDATVPGMMALGAASRLSSIGRKKKGVGIVYTGFNMAKAVVGAGSFALPWACKNLGLAGGIISMAVAAVLAVHTIEMLMRVKDQVEAMQRRSSVGLSYVDVTRETLGEFGAYCVFAAMFCASMGACSAYLSFIGSTLVDISEGEGSWMHEHFSTWTRQDFERAVMLLIMPLTWLRSFRFLRFTSTVGTAAVFLALCVAMWDGLAAFPTWGALWTKTKETPLWPEGFRPCAQSIGCIMFLFCSNFLMIPIGRAMLEPERFAPTLEATFVPITLINMLFGGICFVYFGSDTREIVTNNLGNDAFLTWVKLLLCIDLLFTYPLAFTSGREIVERVWMDDRDVVHDTETLGAIVHDGQAIVYEISPQDLETPAQTPSMTPSASFRSLSEMQGDDGLQNDASSTASANIARRPPPLARKKRKPVFARGKHILIRSTLVFFSYLFAQAKSFGIITNVVGGLAQGSLALVVPPAMDIQLNYESLSTLGVTYRLCLMVFGITLGAVTTFEALDSSPPAPSPTPHPSLGMSAVR